MYHVTSLVWSRSNRFSPLWYRWLLGQGFLNAITSVYICIIGQFYGCVYIVFSIGESPRVCSKYLSRCDRIPFECKGALSVNFSSIAIELNVPRDEFSSIAIEPTVSVALRRGFIKSRFSSLISVTPGTRIFKCDYLSLYLHNWRCYGCV